MSTDETDIEDGLLDEGPLCPETTHEYIVPEEGIALRCDAWLATVMPEVSRARVQALIKENRVLVNGKSTKASAKLCPGSCVTIAIHAPVSAIPEPEEIPLSIIYEDSDCLVLNKPAGLVVHPAPGHASGTLVNAVLFHCRDLKGIGGVERPGIVHRLDKDTSGVMVVAKHDTAMAGLVNAFQEGCVRKIYLALVHGVLRTPSGTLSTLIGRHPVHRKKMAIVARNGKRAVTHYRVIAQSKGLSLVACRIETGRTHQIRVHLQSLGCPIVGDEVYGRSSADNQLTVKPQRQLLHAAYFAFPHPISGVSMAFSAPLPDDFKAVLHAVGLPVEFQLEEGALTVKSLS